MNDDLAETLAELELLKTRYSLEIIRWEKLSRDVTAWLDAGNELRQSVTQTAANARATRDRLARMHDKLEQQNDADEADWWKNDRG